MSLSLLLGGGVLGGNLVSRFEIYWKCNIPGFRSYTLLPVRLVQLAWPARRARHESRVCGCTFVVVDLAFVLVYL